MEIYSRTTREVQAVSSLIQWIALTAHGGEDGTVSKTANILFLLELTLLCEKNKRGSQGGHGQLCLRWLMGQIRGEVRAWWPRQGVERRGRDWLKGPPGEELNWGERKQTVLWVFFLCVKQKKKWECEVKTGFLKMEKYSMCVVVGMISGENEKWRWKRKMWEMLEEDPWGDERDWDEGTLELWS